MPMKIIVQDRKYSACGTVIQRKERSLPVGRSGLASWRRWILSEASKNGKDLVQEKSWESDHCRSTGERGSVRVCGCANVFFR